MSDSLQRAAAASAGLERFLSVHKRRFERRGGYGGDLYRGVYATFERVDSSDYPVMLWLVLPVLR